ncbi:Glycosyltransferase involved in cell wall bisynthesis [Clostridium cavendishii DSM 21758]|uniref:Glycosyltransferase involved in cell wall bisynthesis n=1 Tax=Clostridium cavendishii DSM 21758 TaxID=1121302 RepID=A0A1M6QBF7_9CLOT|nr:glycosyltransferase family 4 protein [Clostridium cavendishii]SHK17498.1 Glycosyltransferase involved in cell wall bisynthesis [Clostridium cavendishii DSM 21758]
MKILLINIGRSYGGVEKFCEHLCEEFQNSDFKMYVLAINKTNFYKKVSNKAITISLPNNKLLAFCYIPLTIYNIIHYKIDLVHCNGLLSSILGTICAKLLKVKVITTVHGIAEYDQKGKLFANMKNKLEKRMLRLNNKCICVSKYVYNYLLLYKIYKDKLKIIYNKTYEGDFEEEYYTNKDIQNSHIIITTIGRLEEVKGQRILMEAVDNVINKFHCKSIQCIIAGDGSDKDYLRKKIKQYGIEEYVKLRGFISDVNVLYKNVDVVIVPSFIETFGLVVLEAMKYGKCIVASNTGGIPELIKNNENGLLFNTGNIEDLTFKILYLINNKEAIKKLGNKARAKYETCWRKYDMKKLYKDVYYEVLGKKEESLNDDI